MCDRFEDYRLDSRSAGTPQGHRPIAYLTCLPGSRKPRQNYYRPGEFTLVGTLPDGGLVEMSPGYREFDMYPLSRGLSDLVLFCLVGLAFLGMGLTMALSCNKISQRTSKTRLKCVYCNLTAPLRRRGAFWGLSASRQSCWFVLGWRRAEANSR